jgi:hypothetical protein
MYFEISRVYPLTEFPGFSVSRGLLSLSQYPTDFRYWNHRETLGGPDARQRDVENWKRDAMPSKNGVRSRRAIFLAS